MGDSNEWQVTSIYVAEASETPRLTSNISIEASNMTCFESMRVCSPSDYFTGYVILENAYDL